MRTQEIFEHAEAPSREGLNVVLEVSPVSSQPPGDGEALPPDRPRLPGNRGQPQFRSAIRGITVRHDAKDLYTSSREMVANEIFEALVTDLNKQGIEVENILLRRIQLPTSVVEAINSKLAAE